MISLEKRLVTQAMHAIMGAMQGCPVQVYGGTQEFGQGLVLHDNHTIFQEHVFTDRNGERAQYRTVIDVSVVKTVLEKGE